MKCLIIFYLFFISLSDQKNLLTTKECPEYWTQLNENKCILISDQKFNFTDAKNFCENYNSTLVSIITDNENKQLSKLLFNDLEYIEYFWLGGKILDEKGEFEWLNKNLLTNYNNFHIDNHDFHENEYIVLMSTIQINKNNEKELGTWCSFNQNIMFLTICQISDTENNSEQELKEINENLFENKHFHWTIFVTTVSLLTLFILIYYYLNKK